MSLPELVSNHFSQFCGAALAPSTNQIHLGNNLICSKTAQVSAATFTCLPDPSNAIAPQPWLCPLRPLPSQRVTSPGGRIPPFESGQRYSYQIVTKQTCQKSGAFLIWVSFSCGNGRIMCHYMQFATCVCFGETSRTPHIQPLADKAFLKQGFIRGTILHLQKMGRHKYSFQHLI